MDDLTYQKRFEQEIQRAMRELGISREEATLEVGLRMGEVHGDGDLVCLHPLTPEQRRAIGLDHDPMQVIAESSARLAAKQHDAFGADDDGVSKDAKALVGHRSGGLGGSSDP